MIQLSKSHFGMGFCDIFWERILKRTPAKCNDSSLNWRYSDLVYRNLSTIYFCGCWNLAPGSWHLETLNLQTWHLESGTWHLRFEPAGEWAITMCPVSICCYSFLYRTSLIEHLTLTLLKGKNSVLLNSVQEFIEIEAKLRLTYFICLNNKLICTCSIVTY